MYQKISIIEQLELRINANDINFFINFDGKSFHGILAPLAKIVYGWMQHPGINRTIISSRGGFGKFDPTTGLYSGTLGMLQRNESDITLDPNIDFGWVQGHGTTRGRLMECEPPAIISAYNSETHVSFVDIILDTSKDIGSANLMAFFSAIVLLTILLGFNYHKPILSVFHYLMQKIPIKTFNVRTYLISITLSITLLYLILIFISLLHVSLVKIQPPVVINDYSDIITRLEQRLVDPSANFKVAWSADYPDTELFRYGTPGSKEAKIWELNGDPFLSKLQGGEMLKVDQELKKQSMVVIMNKGYSYFFRTSICSLNDANTSFHTWISVDKDAKWNQKGYVIRESLSGPLRSFIDDRTQRILDSGLILYFNRASKNLELPVFKYSRKNCSSDVIMMDHEESEGTSLGYEQLMETFYACVFLLVFATMSLLAEMITKRRSNFFKSIKINIVRMRPRSL